jgi:hypothetical protein
VTHNIISKNDASHGIVRIPSDVRSLFPASGKLSMFVNGTRRTVNRCRDMVTGLGRIFKEAGIVGGEQATWASVKDADGVTVPTLTFCAGACAPSAVELTDTYMCADGTTVPATIPFVIETWIDNIQSDTDATKASDPMGDPPEPDADLVEIGTTRLRDLCVDMGLSGYGKLNAADLRMFVTKARRGAK